MPLVFVMLQKRVVTNNPVINNSNRTPNVDNATYTGIRFCHGYEYCCVIIKVTIAKNGEIDTVINGFLTTLNKVITSHNGVRYKTQIKIQIN